MIALIDADTIKYRAAGGAQEVWYDIWLKHDEETWELIGSQRYKKDAQATVKVLGYEDSCILDKRTKNFPLDYATAIADHIIQGIKEKTKATELKLFLTGKGNFREKIYPLYKANRDRDAAPKHVKGVEQHLIEAWGAEVINGAEADDAMAWWQWKDLDNCACKKDAETIICTPDKDLNMVPGWHYDFTKPDSEVKWVKYHEATRFFYYQLLAGDTVDNIPGLHRVGLKTAEKLLNEIPSDSCELYKEVFSIYRGRHEFSGYSDEDLRAELTLRGRLLWMQQSPYQRWEPPC